MLLVEDRVDVGLEVLLALGLEVADQLLDSGLEDDLLLERLLAQERLQRLVEKEVLDVLLLYDLHLFLLTVVVLLQLVQDVRDVFVLVHLVKLHFKLF